MKHYLIDMKTGAILGRFDNADEAEALLGATTGPTHLTQFEPDTPLNTPDLVKIWNALPGQANPVQRFSDKKTALRRVLALLEGGHAPENEPTLVDAVPAQEARPSRRPRAKAKKPAAKKSPHKVRKEPTNGDGRPLIDYAVAVAAAGRKENVRFNTGSPRSKVFAVIKAHDEPVTVERITKKLPDFSRSQILGCISKLRAKEYIKLA